MPRTKVVIGYSQNLASRRTLVLPHDDAEVPERVAWLQSMGDAVLVGTLADYLHYGPDAMLARHLGRKPQATRCAIINHAGYVVAVLNADPAIDRHPAGRLHRDPAGVAVVGRPCKNLSLLP